MLCNIRILILFLLTTLSISDTDHDQQFAVHRRLKLHYVTEIDNDGIPTPVANITGQHRGQILYNQPLEFKNSSSETNNNNNASTLFSFSTTFVFSIINPFPDVLKEGISLFISPTNSLPEMTTNVSSRVKPTNTLFIEFTKKVKDHDLVKTNDTQLAIIREEDDFIEQSPLEYLNEENELQKVDITSGEPIQVWIDYDANHKKIDVTISPLSVSKPSRALLSTEIDLTTMFSEKMYVGISTFNEAYLSSHYLLGWSFNVNGLAKELDGSQLLKFAPVKERAFSTWEFSEIEHFEIVCFSDDGNLIKLEGNSSALEEKKVSKRSKKLRGMALDA